MLNGLDLFSGIGGLSIALKDWIRPIAYCEIDPYCQGVLLSRMSLGSLGRAPIWDDIRSFDPSHFYGNVDIIYGGFPCQGISVAGLGKGLEDERSGLFFEIVRLAREISPSYIFLENVPAITSRGGVRAVTEIASLGYDCRWLVISAASIGASHKRERWFLLAHSNGIRCDGGGNSWQKRRLQDDEKRNNSPSLSNGKQSQPDFGEMDPILSDSMRKRLSICRTEKFKSESIKYICEKRVSNYWENTEPPVCGIPHGISHRVDRIKSLGNAVVPSQAKEAFKILMGL